MANKTMIMNRHHFNIFIQKSMILTKMETLKQIIIKMHYFK